MKTDLLMGDQTLFRNKDIFEIDHIPEQFDFRETQLKELAYAIRPAMSGCRPFNTLIQGLPGTGKTTSVRLLFSQIEETTKRVVPVYINCKNDKARYPVFATIFNRLFGHYPPSSGVSFRRVYNEIGNYLAEHRMVAVVCLDDANYLTYDNHQNDVFYSLLRLYEEFPGARLGVIATVSNLEVDFMSKLDMAVTSVFLPQGIYFSPYGYEEIREILSQRVKAGLYPGVMSNEILDLISERAASAGDLRVGLELLKSSAKAAECAARKEILPEDVGCISSSICPKNFHLREAVSALSPDEKKILRLIAEESGKNDGPLTSGILYKCARARYPIGYMTFYERLEKFDSMKIIELRYFKAIGRSREIILRYEVEEILRVL